MTRQDLVVVIVVFFLGCVLSMPISYMFAINTLKSESVSPVPRGKGAAPGRDPWDNDPVVTCACGNFEFQASSFRGDIEDLIDDGDYATAYGLLMSAYIDELVEVHPDSLIGVESLGGRATAVPLGDREFRPESDWAMPLGNGKVSSFMWIEGCRKFAEKYNRRALKKQGTE